MKNLIVALLAIALSVLVGCSTSETTPTATNPPVTAADRGRLIFETGGARDDYGLELICINCHSLDGSVSSAMGTGPSLQGISERAADRVPGLSAEEYIRQSIMDPWTFLVEGYIGSMPQSISAFLSEEEIDNLVAFLLTQ